MSLYGYPIEQCKSIVMANEPFRGVARSFLLPDGTVAWSEKTSETRETRQPDGSVLIETRGERMTLAEYVAERGQVVLYTDDEFFAMVADYERGQRTPATEETAEQWDDALNVLPPCRWHRYSGIGLFHISERLQGSLVSWHADVEGRYFTFIDFADTPSAELAAKVRAAL